MLQFKIKFGPTGVLLDCEKNLLIKYDYNVRITQRSQNEYCGFVVFANQKRFQYVLNFYGYLDTGIYYTNESITEVNSDAGV